MSNVQALKEAIADQPVNPLRANQVREYKEERARLTSMVRAPHWQSGADRSKAAKSIRQVDKILNDGAPKPITDPLKRDHVAKLANEVLENVIKPSQLTEAEMVRNPAGAVDAYRRREGSKPVKEAILAWRRAVRALEPDNDEQDFTNVERFRRSGTGAGASRFMADAQLPGNFAMSPEAKANWPLGDALADNPLAQARRRELSPEQKAAAAARAANARKAKEAKRLAASQSIVLTDNVDTSADSGGEGSED